MKVKLRVDFSDIYIDCPHCGEELGGWYVDPRGLIEKCDSCNNTFEIPKDVEIELIE